MADLIAPPAEHPSVAWWAACPWITDRLPTKADASESGYVILLGGAGYALAVQWSHVLLGRSWIHSYEWRPNSLTLGQRIDAELAANAELSPELRAILIEAKSVVGGGGEVSNEHQTTAPTPPPEPPAAGEVAELVALIRQCALAWEPDARLLGNMTAAQLVRAAELLERTATPPRLTPPPLAPDYIDPEHHGEDRELLQVFYAACNAEGGTADEIHLRGIRAVMAACTALATPPPALPTDEERLADFAQWLAREIPPNTIIGDPLWWAPRIWRAVHKKWGAAMTTTKERPIRFKSEEVRAVLDGSKTQTWQIVKNQGDMEFDANDPTYGPYWLSYATEADGEDAKVRCPFGKPGDRLWVRETWGMAVDNTLKTAPCYRADEPVPVITNWQPSTTMPRWASRILLEITAVRVERLQSISQADAQAERLVNPWVWVVEFRRVQP